MTSLLDGSGNKTLTHRRTIKLFSLSYGLDIVNWIVSELESLQFDVKRMIHRIQGLPSATMELKKMGRAKLITSPAPFAGLSTFKCEDSLLKRQSTFQTF